MKVRLMSDGTPDGAMTEPKTMVERMARIICAFHHAGEANPGERNPYAAAFIDAEWPNFSGVARAVLQSMRDQPSEAMIAALRPMTDATIGPGRFEIEAVIRDWRILIDAALKEGE